MRYQLIYIHSIMLLGLKRFIQRILVDETFYLLIHYILIFSGLPAWILRYAIMDLKVCHHGLQGMPSLTSRYAIMDFKVCHHGLRGMPSWSSRYAIMDFKVCHYGLQGMPSWTSRQHATKKICINAEYWRKCVSSIWK